MKVKTNRDGSKVSLAGLQMKMRQVLIFANEIWEEEGQELVVTETLAGVHSPSSLHPYGYALDLRTRYFKKVGQAERVAQKLRDRLGKDYDIVVHKTHIHAEYDKIKLFY